MNIAQCDCEDCYNMDTDITIHFIDKDTEAFLLRHLNSAFKWSQSIDHICEECLVRINADYHELLIFDELNDLTINQKYIDLPELMQGK